MAISTEEAKEDIEQMVEILEELRPEYAKLALNGKKVEEASYNMLLRMRKLAQNYLHEAILIRKDEIQKRLTEIEKESRTCKDIKEEYENVLALKEGRYEDTKYTAGGSSAHEISRAVVSIQEYLKRLKEKGLATGTIKIDTSKVKPTEVTEEKIEMLREKLKLIKESQKYDRTLQSFMNKIASCTRSDSSYEIQKKRLQERIKKLEECE